MTAAANKLRWHFKGKAHVFGHDVPHDNAMMPFEQVIKRVTDPKQLIPRLFEGIRPGLWKELRPGDLVIGGRNFSKGKSHIQAYYALREIGIGVICESMPYNTYRQLVGQGLPFLTGCDGVSSEASDGDEVEADFLSGLFVNHTRGTRRQFRPVDPSIVKYIELGGMMGALREWVAQQSKQSTPAQS